MECILNIKNPYISYTDIWPIRYCLIVGCVENAKSNNKSLNQPHWWFSDTQRRGKISVYESETTMANFLCPRTLTIKLQIRSWL